MTKQKTKTFKKGESLLETDNDIINSSTALYSKRDIQDLIGGLVENATARNNELVEAVATKEVLDEVATSLKFKYDESLRINSELQNKLTKFEMKERISIETKTQITDIGKAVYTDEELRRDVKKHANKIRDEYKLKYGI